MLASVDTCPVEREEDEGEREGKVVLREGGNAGAEKQKQGAEEKGG